ncbi:unnamed protein product [Closterium sp. NIES-54]
MVTTTTPGGQRVSICTCTRTGRHLATFTRRPGSSLYTLTTEPPQVAAFGQVFASGLVAAPCSCRLLSHQTLLWHHRLGHPSLPRIRGMHSRLHFSGLPSAPLFTLGGCAAGGTGAGGAGATSPGGAGVPVGAGGTGGAGAGGLGGAQTKGSGAARAGGVGGTGAGDPGAGGSGAGEPGVGGTGAGGT